MRNVTCVGLAGVVWALTACGNRDLTCLAGAEADCDAVVQETEPAFESHVPLTQRIAALSLDLGEGSRGGEVRAVHEYLMQYGYLPNVKLSERHPSWRPIVDRAPAELDVFDAATSAAVIAYQEFFGLPATGIVDAATLALWRTQRCGVPEGISAADSTEKWALESPYTRGVPVTWRVFANVDAVTSPFDLDGTPLLAQLRADFIAAQDTWKAETSLTFSELNGPSANISVGFATPSSCPDNVLGCAPFPADPTPHVLRVINTPWVWHTDGNAPSGGENHHDLQSLLLHELGHSLGVAHSSMPNAVMYPSLSFRRTLSLDDKLAISNQYDEWTPVGNATASDLDVGGSSTWMLGTSLSGGGYAVYKWKGASCVVSATEDCWQAAVPSTFRATSIAADGVGNAWAISNSRVYKRTLNGAQTSSATSGVWTEVAAGVTCATNVDVAWSTGHVWVVNCSGSVSRLNAAQTGWISTGNSSVLRLGVDATGVVYVVHNNGTFERRTTAGVWQSMPGTGRDVTAGSPNPVADANGLFIPTVYSVSTSALGSNAYKTQAWNEQTAIAGEDGSSSLAQAKWRQIDGGSTRISVGPDSQPWIIGGSGAIYRRTR